MPYWKKTVAVNSLLGSFVSEEILPIDVPKIAAALVELLDQELPEYMEEYGNALREMAEETDRDYMSIDSFDEELEALYEYADTCRIWFGNLD